MQEAARHAARLVQAGECLFVDCGTTMPHLAARLPRETDLTIVCYSLNIAMALCRRPNTPIIRHGGLHHPSPASFASPEAPAARDRLGITSALLSA